MQKKEKQTIKKDKEKGITLVALVITIIVLLILAGVTISSIFGDSGIIKNATEAQILTELSNVKEALEMYKITNYSHGDMSNEELVEEGLLKEVFIKDTYRTVAVITNLKTIDIKGKLGKGGAKQENTEEETLLDMYNVYGVDMADGTLYYIRDGIWSIEGEKVTYIASTGEEKEGYVVETINGQYLEDRKFITEWTVEAGTTITLPITSAPDITIEWGSDEDGDGELDVETCTIVKPTHTYANAGTYTIKISGTMKQWNFQTVATSKDYITQIVQWGNTKIESLKFYNCSNLAGTIPSHKTEKEFSNLTGTANMFYNCSNLTGSIPEDLFKNAKMAWGDLRYCFQGCEGLTGSIPKDLFSDCTDAKQLEKVFYGCKGLTGEIPSGLLKNNTKITNVREMFRGCTGINGKIPEGLFSNCPNITNLYLVFSGTSITEIPANLFDINKGQPNGITSLEGAFEKTKITTVPAGLFDLCTSVKAFGTGHSYGGIFQGCTLLETIPANLFAKNTEVTTFGNAFNGCSSLKEIPDGLFYNNTKVTSFNAVFWGCSALKEIPENTFNTSEAVSIYWAFSGCSSLTKIGAGVFANMPNITNVSALFSNCTNLIEIEEGFYIPENATSIAQLFMGCSNLTTIPDGLIIPETVTDINSSFLWCSNLNATIILKSNQVTNNTTFTNINSNFRLNWAYPCTEEKINEILTSAGKMNIKGIDVTETE